MDTMTEKKYYDKDDFASRGVGNTALGLSIGALGLELLKNGGLGLSIVDANINKMDKFIELFEDENGEIDVNGLINNLSSMNEPIKIDLTTISPLLPNRVLLITKDDFNEILTYDKQG